MTFKDFCEYLAKIEATPKRLEMTSLLSELLKQADSNEVDKVVMLSLGRLAPLYKDIDFGMAEKTVIRSLAVAYNLETKIVLESFKKAGDLGEVASELKIKYPASASRSPLGTIRSRLPPAGAPARLAARSVAGRWSASDWRAGTERSSAGRQKSKTSVIDVYQALLDIASQSGEKSQERKLTKTAQLLRQLDPLGAKYAVRIILQNLRLGFSDKTALDALSVIIAGDKSAREKLEGAYNVRPDVGALARQIINHKSPALASRSPSGTIRSRLPPAGAPARLAARSVAGRWSASDWRAGTERSSAGREIRNFKVEPELGTPILPALCQRLPTAEEIITKMRQVAVEPKWDGQRIQAHLSLNPKSKIKNQKSKIANINLFTRSLEDVTEMFPDLVNALNVIPAKAGIYINNLNRFRLPASKYGAGYGRNDKITMSFILDGEVIAVDPKTGKPLPFQTMITRKRKYGIQEKLADVPVRYMVFDVLYLNGKSLIGAPFVQRREMLEKLLGSRNTQKTQKARMSDKSENQKTRDSGSPILRSSDISGSPSVPSVLEIAPQIVTNNPVEIREFLHRQISRGLEGVVAKRTDAPYIPGRTQFAWVKLKWEGSAKSGGLLDTVDCVVMGTYSGRGKRAGFGAGAFLVGILSGPSTSSGPSYPSFLTISKIGTGLTDEQWKELKVKGQRLKVKDKPKEYEAPKELTPDRWLRPELVAEIQADNITKSPLHTAGYALRFPRLVRYRADKRPEQATTLEEVKKLYEMQS